MKTMGIPLIVKRQENHLEIPSSQHVNTCNGVFPKRRLVTPFLFFNK